MRQKKTIINVFICIVVAVFFSFCGCTLDKRNENSIIQFDLNASYIEKEINLEEIAIIEYLQLEFDEDFLFNEFEAPKIITDNKVIISRNNGDILVFSRSGRPLYNFNHRGMGPEEYPFITEIIYDEISDELFVRASNKMMVYSSSGEFRKVIPLLEGSSIRIIVNYDSETFLLNDEREAYPSPFTFISKEDGSVVETVDFPIAEIPDLGVIRTDNGMNITVRPINSPILGYKDGYLLTVFSNDTIYYFSPQKELSPILIRKPPIHSMNPVITLRSFVEAGNYEFMYSEKVELVNNSFPGTYLMRDKKTGAVYKQKITLNDFEGKELYISSNASRYFHDCRLGLNILSLVELQDANRENKLSGKLKELVENSDEDGNPVYMLLHFK